MVIFHTNLKGNVHIMGCSGWGNYYKNYHYLIFHLSSQPILPDRLVFDFMAS